MVHRSLNRDAFGQSMIQMSGSSLALDLCLLLAYNRYTLSGVDSCVVVAALVHFFSLSTQLWITVAGHCLRATLTLDRTVSDNCWALCKRLLLAWGKRFLVQSRFEVFTARCYAERGYEIAIACRLSVYWVPPIISGTGKATNHFVCTFTGSMG